ncbi:endoglucanase; Glycosyl Hydrolase family 12 [Thermofilum pendens Hrk 5]|uniref:Endoglucanase Glycosyl Hydrolase family 12 n=1 Tax=Thermofilum pendens (strain DSM 2475 / Hrk 5) TaxID=368408 RepID=A1S0U6_THEPD|nr:endoglucanase; Glycosyl Hydrolase family 12 [Thermofilum pendens Hrk 5]
MLLGFKTALFLLLVLVVTLAGIFITVFRLEEPQGRLTLVPCSRYAVAVADGSRVSVWKPVGAASIDPNLWGLVDFEGSGLVRGSARMECRAGGPLLIETALEVDAPLRQGVVAYHEVIYGVKPFGVDPAHPLPRDPLPLPARLDLLPRVVALAEYSVHWSSTGVNVAYDVWLKRRAGEPGVSRGDLEVMVWLYWDNATPAGSAVSRFEAPVLVNCTLKPLNWTVWIQRSIGGGWTYVAFTPSAPVRSGSVAVDLKLFLDKAVELLEESTPGQWSARDLHVVSVEFGSEVFYSKRIAVSWELRRLELLVSPSKTTAEEALRGACKG